MSSLEKGLFSPSAHFIIELFGVFCFFFFYAQLYEFLIYFWYYVLLVGDILWLWAFISAKIRQALCVNTIKYMICKYIFTFGGLPYHFMDGFLFLTGSFLVWCSLTWLFLLLLPLLLVSNFKKSSPNPISRNLLIVFYSKNFMVSCFSFNFFINFELILYVV